MGKIDYQKIYDTNQDDWKALTREPQKYEALLAGHYSDSNHFVYELLQNAEDEKATKVVIEFYKDQLVFYHNGDPFDEADVRGVSSMLMGTKDRNDAQTIGRFGMGFKSVFKYTFQPEIYSDDEAFIIKNYLLPVESSKRWNPDEAKGRLFYPDGGSIKYVPFKDADHLTKIIIPFKKRDGNGQVVSVSGIDVLDKLNSLTGEILLFLTWIRDLYWINRENGKYVHITLAQVANDDNLLTCRISGSANSGRETITRYLRYKKIFDHPSMKSAEVSVAYKVGATGKTIEEISNTPVWVYFPTRDMTALPFLIHGSFETAVSREKLMTPSKFNDDLFNKLGDLIADSMVDLAIRSIITQVFLRRIVIASFNDEEKNGTIKGLRRKISTVFRNYGIIPDKDGVYRKNNELSIPVPFRLSDMQDSVLFGKAVEHAGSFVAFNNERERNFNEYYSWLKEDLQIREFRIATWAKALSQLPVQHISPAPQHLEDVKNLYGFLSDYRESLFETNLTYSRSGAYEQSIRDSVKKAWFYLREAPIILNRDNDLVPAYIKGSLAVYLSDSTRLGAIEAGRIINSHVSRPYEQLFRDGFGIVEYNSFQYVKENIVKIYTGDLITVNETQYLSDIKQIIELADRSHNLEEIQKLLNDAKIIKIKKGEFSLESPHEVYSEISDEGINLHTFYSLIYLNPYTSKLSHSCLDQSYYRDNGIGIASLKKLGIVTSPVIEGTRFNYSGIGDNYWQALDRYCPNIEIQGLQGNLDYIRTHPTSSVARSKSAELLKLLISISDMLAGKIRKRKSKPYDVESKASILQDISYSRWVFDRYGELKMPSQMSRYDLNTEIYGDLVDQKDELKILGFVETDTDSRAETFELVESLGARDKKIMFRQLARDLGYDISNLGNNQESETNEKFDPNAWQSEEFPQRRVRSIESLVEHVRQEFYCADPTKYEKVYRQIRTSKYPKIVRAYALGMYTNDGDVQICQICKKPTKYAEAIEIANYGIELPQLHLCLCRDCAARYKQLRDVNKEQFKDEITKAIQRIDYMLLSEDYEIALNSEESIHFTQTHIAEIKEIISLLQQYGVPGSDSTNREIGRVFSSDSSDNNYSTPNTVKEHFQTKNMHSTPVVGSYLRPDPNNARNEAGKNKQQEKGKPRVGSRVYSPKYGYGTIYSVEETAVEIIFNRYGKKMFKYPAVFDNGMIKLV